MTPRGTPRRAGTPAPPVPSRAAPRLRSALLDRRGRGRAGPSGPAYGARLHRSRSRMRTRCTMARRNCASRAAPAHRAGRPGRDVHAHHDLASATVGTICHGRIHLTGLVQLRGSPWLGPIRARCPTTSSDGIYRSKLAHSREWAKSVISSSSFGAPPPGAPAGLSLCRRPPDADAIRVQQSSSRTWTG
jgi:hypothetical protein